MQNLQEKKQEGLATTISTLNPKPSTPKHLNPKTCLASGGFGAVRGGGLSLSSLLGSFRKLGWGPYNKDPTI